uniref:Uncharacterized protein n=1 Tax=Solanum lycopersicum TaxID=4081 RepID=A0A3Q7GQM0_SOLLC
MQYNRDRGYLFTYIIRSFNFLFSLGLTHFNLILVHDIQLPCALFLPAEGMFQWEIVYLETVL